MRTLLISGASRGIGRAIAERFLADGHRLSLGLRNRQALVGTPLDPAIAGADRVLLHPYDAEDPAAAEAWVQASIEHFGGFDSVVHSAGIFSRAGVLFEPGQEEEINRTMAVNLMGPWWLTRAAWPQLAAHGEGLRWPCCARAREVRGAPGDLRWACVCSTARREPGVDRLT